MCLGTEQGRLAVIFPPEPLSCPRSEYPLRWALGRHQGRAVKLLDTRLEHWTTGPWLQVNNRIMGLGGW